MVEEKDIKEALKTINQNMLLNKKKVDIDNIIESIVLFFNNYFTTLSITITDNICNAKNISNEDSHYDLIKQLVSSFFKIIQSKIKETTSSKFNNIKNKIDTLSDDDFIKELNRVSIVIVNDISEYYLENATDLINEINKREGNDKYINDYLKKVIFTKVINTLKDRLMYSIKVIDNNNEENNKIIEDISEKTVNEYNLVK